MCIRDRSTSNKLAFKYLKYDDTKTAVPRYGGMTYVVNPYALVWVDDVYYLIANMDKYDGLAHYRVDRMMSANVLENKRRPVTELLGFEDGLDAAEYIKGRFTMFSGDERRVQVKFHKSLRDVVYDRFGTSVTSYDEGDYMIVTINVLPSKGFFSWLFLLGDNAEILFPDDIKEQYRKMLIEIIDKYNYNDNHVK
jgi:predicted DNA-binding transcriptional regulator YafY